MHVPEPEIHNNPKAVVLLSGGLDSATCCFAARAAGYALYALTVNYGQRAQRELQAAKDIAHAAGALAHYIYPLDLTLWGGSALTDRRLEIPTAGIDETYIPITYVPARNTLLLSLALSWAEVVGASAIFIGVNSLDYSGYPDCRPEFIEAYQGVVNVATKATVQGAKIKIETPLQQLSKVEIVRLAFALHVPLDQTWSCYQNGPLACGVCDSCRLRLAAIEAVQQERAT